MVYCRFAIKSLPKVVAFWQKALPTMYCFCKVYILYSASGMRNKKNQDAKKQFVCTSTPQGESIQQTECKALLFHI